MFRPSGETQGESCERLLSAQVRLMVSHMRAVNPRAVEALLDERDVILTKALLACQGRTARPPRLTSCAQHSHGRMRSGRRC